MEGINHTLADKVAVVTGGSRGIGRAIALRLASAGAKVIINYNKSEEKAKSVLEELKAKGGEGEILRFDVSDEKEVTESFSYISKKYDKINILVNNAGIARDNILIRMKSEEWHEVMKVNLDSVFYCTRACLRSMLKQRSGVIINMTSVVGIMGNPGQANYCAAKAGVIGFTKSIAREVASRNIRVNAVAPGFITTDMTLQLSEEVKKNILLALPSQRFGTPEEVAELVYFLVSDSASYITGQVIGINGGMLM
jgi:3-oxoacyl-[acyl-carrier protein] reductase